MKYKKINPSMPPETMIPPPSGIGIKRALRISQQVRMPTIRSLEEDMNLYLSSFRKALQDNLLRGGTVFGDRKDDIEASYNERGPHLIRAARLFDEYTIHGIGYPRLDIGNVAEPLVQEVNQGTRILPRGRDFREVLSSYYTELDGKLRRVVDNSRMRGVDYWMDDVYGYNELAAHDLEDVCEILRQAKSISEDELGPRSDEYRKLSEQMRNEQGGLVQVTRGQLVMRLQRVVEMLEQEAPIEPTKRVFLRATHDMLHHLGQLGEDGLKAVGIKGDRPLHTLPGGPPHQLEAMLSIANADIRSYEDAAALHRGIIRGEELAA